ncbi:hypothetical protein FB45DRAFT_954533 [Roridomyces roridus]|uniref:Secreted protein n=1 Tax=Roridomyces roridus TaxID=1738132 RepID=A0AAD7AZ00_9AGAR|nr:hypothetical protein FB45DRAFT_954533 [Roridomyces roridus]
MISSQLLELDLLLFFTETLTSVLVAVTDDEPGGLEVYHRRQVVWESTPRAIHLSFVLHFLWVVAFESSRG